MFSTICLSRPVSTRKARPNEMSYIQNQIPDTILDTVDWSLLENQVIKYFKTPPDFVTLAGMLDPVPKKEIIRKTKTVKEPQAATKRPENVVTMSKEEQSVEQTVERIKKLITRSYKSNQKPIDFFQLVLHPNDFGKTVENILHVSFLVRDGIIKITKDDLGTLVIQPCSKETINQVKKAGKGCHIQNVVDFNYQQWKTLRDTYRLERPMIDFEKEN